MSWTRRRRRSSPGKPRREAEGAHAPVPGRDDRSRGVSRRVAGMKAGETGKEALLIDMVIEEFDPPRRKGEALRPSGAGGRGGGGRTGRRGEELKEQFREELKANGRASGRTSWGAWTNGDLGGERGAEYRRMGRMEGRGPGDGESLQEAAPRMERLRLKRPLHSSSKSTFNTELNSQSHRDSDEKPTQTYTLVRL